MSITLTQLKREIATYLGYDRNSANWSSSEDDDVDAVIASGERMLYYSPVNAETGKPHVWSFLVEDLDTQVSQGDRTLPMPEGFTKLQGAVSLAGGGELGVVDEGHIRAMHAESNAQAKPEYYALVSSGGIYRLSFFPEADQTYRLTTRFRKAFTSIQSEPPPAERSELVLSACLAAAERTFRPELGAGVQAERYQMLLQAAIREDLEFADRAEESELWEVEDVPSDLAVTKGYLKKLIGREFGYGAAPSTWTKGQSSSVEEALRTGLRYFYSPPALQGERSGHEWSFIKATAHLDLVANQTEYDLPDDFSMIEGGLTYEPTASTLYPPIQLWGEQEIRKRLQYNTTSSRPVLGAVRAKNGSPTRWELLLYPKPDQAYRLDYRYWISPGALGDDEALPFGGQPHAQTVIDACLAAVESMTAKTAGARYERFMSCLRTSVGHDRKVTSPDRLGRRSSHDCRTIHGLSDYLIDTSLIERN